MANQELLDYIKQRLQQGINKEQIKNSLLSNGWHTQYIDEALNSSTQLNQSITQNNAIPQPSLQLSKSKKIILGIAALLPVFCITTLLLSKNIHSTALEILLALLFSALYIPITIFINLLYIIILLKDGRISKKQKTLWTMMFSTGIFITFTGAFIISLFTLPIYWYLYVWKKPKQNQLP